MVRYRILVVEDEPHIRRILTALLSDAGFDVTPMEDGLMAIEELEGDSRIDLVVTDLVMPRCDGFGLLERIRALPSRCHLPVLVLTAKGEESDRTRALQGGVSAFLTKPFSPRKLIVRIEELLS